MVSFRSTLLAAACLTLLACGGSSGTTTGDSAATTTAATTTAAGSGGTAPVLPAAPLLEMVMPMASVLHVEWSEPEPCDEIEAERMDPTHPYAVAFTVPGTKINHMDGKAFEDMMYTYRLRCKVGDLYSEYSNEKSANPTKKQ
jgi:hypothetical protein